MTTFHQVLTFIAFAGLCVTGAVLLAHLAFPFLCRAWDSFSTRSEKAVLLLAVCLATLYGGSKHVSGTITFPRTDPETWYFLNAGSYVTNDAVRVKFTKSPIVPDSANIFLDGLELCYTNDADWTTHSFNAYSNVVGSSGTDFTVNVAAATNYNWICYTDWTPPPVVHTNGVAYVVWQIGANKPTNDLAMTRTGVYTNMVRLAPNPAITNLPPVSLNLTTSTGDNNED